jgi:hypothetical protein
MNYSIIQIPPQNIADYVKVSTTDVQAKFTESLNQLLQQGASHICTDMVPIEWATKALEKPNVSHYQKRMQQVPVNFGEPGTAHAILFLERQA